MHSDGNGVLHLLRLVDMGEIEGTALVFADPADDLFFQLLCSGTAEQH